MAFEPLQAGGRSGASQARAALRDIAPADVLECDNVTDDVDHVCRAATSLHLAEQLVGHRDFIRCTLGEILTGAAPARRDPDGVVVFSPFGLGILDISVATMVSEAARACAYAAARVAASSALASWLTQIDS